MQRGWFDMENGYPIAIAETGPFSEAIALVLSETELSELVDWIAYNPTAGDIVPDSGGVRCLVWSTSGKGRKDERDRPQVCVYYYFRDLNIPVYLLFAERSGNRGQISFLERGMMKSLVESLLKAHRPHLEKKIAANRA